MADRTASTGQNARPALPAATTVAPSLAPVVYLLPAPVGVLAESCLLVKIILQEAFSQKPVPARQSQAQTHSLTHSPTTNGAAKASAKKESTRPASQQ